MSSDAMNRTALIMGATGAVGKAVLKEVLKNGNYERVVTVGRREAKLDDDSIPQEKLVQKIVDYENLEAHREAFRKVDDVYCCLGTTRADAGSAEAFKRIDQGYVLKAAKLIAEENKPTTGPSWLSPVHFLYCSSMGANKNSLFLYPQSKGQTEEGIAKAGFQRVSIFRPGYLELEEPRPRPRLGENVFGSIISPVNRLFNLHLAAPVMRVAHAMRKAAMEAKPVPSDAKESVVDIFSNADIDDMWA